MGHLDQVLELVTHDIGATHQGTDDTLGQHSHQTLEAVFAEPLLAPHP